MPFPTDKESLRTLIKMSNQFYEIPAPTKATKGAIIKSLSERVSLNGNTVSSAQEFKVDPATIPKGRVAVKNLPVLPRKTNEEVAKTLEGYSTDALQKLGLKWNTHYIIPGHLEKMEKAEIVSAVEQFFELKDGNIHFKKEAFTFSLEGTRPVQAQSKKKALPLTVPAPLHVSPDLKAALAKERAMEKLELPPPPAPEPVPVVDVRAVIREAQNEVALQKTEPPKPPEAPLPAPKPLVEEIDLDDFESWTFKRKFYWKNSSDYVYSEDLNYIGKYDPKKNEIDKTVPEPLIKEETEEEKPKKEEPKLKLPSPNWLAPTTQNPAKVGERKFVIPMEFPLFGSKMTVIGSGKTEKIYGTDSFQVLKPDVEMEEFWKWNQVEKLRRKKDLIEVVVVFDKQTKKIYPYTPGAYFNWDKVSELEPVGSYDEKKNVLTYIQKKAEFNEYEFEGKQFIGIDTPDGNWMDVYDSDEPHEYYGKFDGTQVVVNEAGVDFFYGSPEAPQIQEFSPIKMSVLPLNFLRKTEWFELFENENSMLVNKEGDYAGFRIDGEINLTIPLPDYFDVKDVRLEILQKIRAKEDEERKEAANKSLEKNRIWQEYRKYEVFKDNFDAVLELQSRFSSFGLDKTLVEEQTKPIPTREQIEARKEIWLNTPPKRRRLPNDYFDRRSEYDDLFKSWKKGTVYDYKTLNGE